MSSEQLGAIVGAAAAVLASPYLARITRTVPDRDDARWWRGATASRQRLALTAAVAAVLGGCAGYAAGWSAALPAFAVFAALATPLLLIDAEHRRLPDRLVLPAAGCAVALLAVAAAVRSDWGALGRAAAAGAIVFAVFCSVALASPRSMGFGDVKLAGVLAVYLGWLGWGEVLYGIFAGFLLGAIAAIGLLASRRASLKTDIALGPALIVGALLVAALN
ncbi:MAG TPA: A24 family peptidase [Jatrophihabitantaceae bacterium]